MFALLVWFQSPEKKMMSALVLALGISIHTNVVAMPHSDREIASMAFPTFRATTDVDDIMDDYPAYLKYVLTIGQDVNPKVARQIEERFNRLRKADEKLAARFLKGLRFEMIQKLELAGLSARSTSTNHPTMRKWVKKYLGLWLREVDEYQFRAYAQAIAKK